MFPERTDLLDSFCQNKVHRGRSIVPEYDFTIEKNLLHFFSVHIKLPVPKRHPWKFVQQILQFVIFHALDPRGVENNRVSLVIKNRYLGFHDRYRIQSYSNFDAVCLGKESLPGQNQKGNHQQP